VETENHHITQGEDDPGIVSRDRTVEKNMRKLEIKSNLFINTWTL
jgi:hypothetical protein